jgi:hypothetical protein
VDPAIIVYQNNHLDPPMSHLLVGGLCAIFAAAVVFCFLEARKAWRAAEEAEGALVKGAPLAPGARFVAGKVELAQGETMAVQVTVTQVGRELQHKNGKSHRFEETQRETRGRPFYLRQESGERIRVAASNKSVLLVDDLDQMEWVDPYRRRRRAELSPGETAVVEGTLAHGDDPEAMASGGSYRDAAARGWVMKPMANGRMHVSTEGLARRHTLRAQAFDRALLVVIALAVAAQLPLYTYWARVLLGQDVAADYMGKTSHLTRDSKGRLSTHYKAWFAYWHGGVSTEDESEDIDRDDYQRLGDKGGKIWIRRVPGHRWATALGPGSSVGVIPWFFAAAMAGIAVFQAHRTHRYRRWYEGTVVDKGSGALPAPPMTRFADDPGPDPEPARATKRKKKQQRGRQQD